MLKPKRIFVWVFCEQKSLILTNWYNPDQQPTLSFYNFDQMIYANYFSSVTKDNGQPNLSADQFRRMMNIVYIEGVINGIKRIKKKETGQFFKYDVLIFKHDSVLTELTGNLRPNALLREMYRLSRN